MGRADSLTRPLTSPSQTFRRDQTVPPPVQVHIALGRRDVRVPQQPAGVLDPLLAADLRPALVATLAVVSSLWAVGIGQWAVGSWELSVGS